MLKTSGVPYDLHYLRDVLSNPSLWRYRVYVFEDTYRLSSDQRRVIAERLQRDGKTLVWVYAPGFVTEQGLSLRASSDLVGMNVQTEAAAKPTGAYAVPVEATATPDLAGKLAAGLPSLQGMGEMYQKLWSLPEPPYLSYDLQRFWVDDPAAAVLARYRDGKAAIAVRRLPGPGGGGNDWTSVYVAPPGGLEGRLLNNIARQAKAFVALDAGPAVEMNGNFLSLHGTVGGRYEITLPRRGTVRAADTGAVLARSATSFTADVQAQHTYWYLLE